MTFFIFSFSYLDMEKLGKIKSTFIFNDLNNFYNLNFLTKKNFNFFFNKKYFLMKSILSGKYLIFSSIKKINSINNLICDLTLLLEFLNSFEEDINLFSIINNENYYFYDFLLDSNKYNNMNNLISFINIKKDYIFFSLLMTDIYKYFLEFNRINNLYLFKNNNFINNIY